MSVTFKKCKNILKKYSKTFGLNVLKSLILHPQSGRAACSERKAKARRSVGGAYEKRDL